MEEIIMDENKVPETSLEELPETNGEQPANVQDGVATQKNALKSVYEWLEIICVAVALMLVIFMFVFRMVVVDGHSMNNTLHHKDRLIISNAFYTPKAGDIVVVVMDSGKYANTPLIKRIIATEGQTIELDTVNWKVFITEKDGTKHELDESAYDSLINRTGEDMENGVVQYPYTVPEGCVFVMGDNRNKSDDSRNLGAMKVEDIVGRVLFRVLPLEKIGTVNE